MTEIVDNQKIDVKSRFLRFNTLLAFIAAAIVIYIFLTRFDFGQTLSIIAKSNFLFYLLALGVFYGFLPLRGHRWRKLLLESDIELRTSELVRIFYQALFVNSILPARIGDIYRAYLLKKRRQISMSLSIGVLFSERVFDLAAIGLLVLLGGIFYLDKVASPDIRQNITTGLIIFGIIVLLFIIFSWRALAIDNDSLVQIGGIPEPEVRKLTIVPPGDANSDGILIGSDVTYLVAYFRGINPEPEPPLAGDANADCLLIGSDVTYLAQYFRGINEQPVRGDCEGLWLWV